MGNSSSRISPLRQRMIDDLTMRRLGAKTPISVVKKGMYAGSIIDGKKATLEVSHEMVLKYLC